MDRSGSLTAPAGETALPPPLSPAWARAAALARDRSVWELERLKLGLERSSSDGESGHGSPTRAGAIGRRAAFLLAALVASAALCIWLLRIVPRRGTEPAPGRPCTLVALNGEWSSRTRHVLGALDPSAPPDAIVLIGRLRAPPARIAAEWRARLGFEPPPVFCPVSVGAAVRAAPQALTLLCEGLRTAARSCPEGFGDRVAMAFRVLLGAVQARWWAMGGPDARRVVFGFTGTADCVLLEQAMQARSAQTVHAVHGLATGPNFVAFSDLAVFRCGHDARAYRELGCYGACTVQPARAAAPRRGESGILLLTNLAHPMNRGFRERGETDEIAVLSDVAEAARLLGERARPFLWKPHPVIATLPPQVAARIREAASGLGFEELPHGPDPAARAAAARWVLTTPSTVTADFLVQGVLCLVLDPQGILADDAPGLLPRPGSTAAEIARGLRALDDDRAFAAAFTHARDMVEPGAPLDLAALLRPKD